MNDFSMSMMASVMPEVFLAVSILFLLIVGVFKGNEGTRYLCWAMMGVFGFTTILIFDASWSDTPILNGMFVLDSWAGYLKAIVLTGLIVTLGISKHYLPYEQINRFEYPILVGLAGLGMMITLSAHSFLSLYMGIELQALSFYVLTSIHSNNHRSAEAGIKYFILGALGSGMILFGISLIYGFAGSIDYNLLLMHLDVSDTTNAGIIVGLVFLLCGFAFKISAAPFHMWTPDIYDGAPMPVTALFAIVPKIAVFGLIARVLYVPFDAFQDQWQQVLWFISALSMIVGSVTAIIQTSLKRLIAYGTIANMGYALMGVVAGTQNGLASVSVFLIIYMVMSAGVFAAVMTLFHQGIGVTKLDDLAGLSKRYPALAYAFAILFFSLAGIPPLAGFLGKLYVFQAAIAEGYFVLTIIGVLTSVIAAFYYLRLIKIMFFDEPEEKFEHVDTLFTKTVIFASTLFAILFIFSPDLLFEFGRAAASNLFY